MSKEEEALAFDELYWQLRQMAEHFPAWLERVDADVSLVPELWGWRVIHIVIPYGRSIWITEAEHKRGATDERTA